MSDLFAGDDPAPQQPVAPKVAPPARTQAKLSQALFRPRPLRSDAERHEAVAALAEVVKSGEAAEGEAADYAGLLRLVIADYDRRRDDAQVDADETPAAALHRLMTAAGDRQADLAGAIGVKRGAVSNYVCGYPIPKPIRVKLAARYGVRPATFAPREPSDGASAG